MSNWNEVLRLEFINELLAIVPQAPRNNVRGVSSVFAPPALSLAAPVHFALARENPATIDRIVMRPSERTLQPLDLQGPRYASFRALAGGPSYGVYQTLNDFHGRLVDRMSAHLRRLALASAAEAAHLQSAEFTDPLGFGSDATRQQFVLALTRVVNTHTRREDMLPEATLQRLATAKVFGDAVVAVTPVYNRALARKDQ